MTIRECPVQVSELPATVNAKQARNFLRELNGRLEERRPRIILDCSKAQHMDRTALHLMLCCLEEAMKRNGDVRLAAVSPGAKAVLDASGIGRLFKIFKTRAEAIASFASPPRNA
jgi:anti-anti-sigma factor